MSSINQIEIRRGTSNGTVETQVYDIGAVGNIDAINVNYNDTVTQLGVSNVQRAIEQLKANFQAGVDKVADACIRKGSTPVSPYTPDTVSNAILAIPTGITPTGRYTYDGSEAPSWIKDITVYAEVDASYVYSKGYSDGYDASLNSYNVIRSDTGTTINANYQCNDNIQIINNTNNTIKCSISCLMIGDNRSISIDGQEVTGGYYEYNGIIDLQAGKTLIFYQTKKSTTSENGFGYIHVTIVGGSSFTNNIAYDGTDTYSGSVTVS